MMGLEDKPFEMAPFSEDIRSFSQGVLILVVVSMVFCISQVRKGERIQFDLMNMGVSQNRVTPKRMVYNGKPC